MSSGIVPDVNVKAPDIFFMLGAIFINLIHFNTCKVYMEFITKNTKNGGM